MASGNPFHDQSGLFTSYDDAVGKGSASFQFASDPRWHGIDNYNFGKGKVRQPGKRGKRASDNPYGLSFGKVRPPCGRVARQAGRNLRCWDGKDLSRASRGEATGLLGRVIMEADTAALDWEALEGEENTWVAVTGDGYILVVSYDVEDGETQPYLWYVMDDPDADEPVAVGFAGTPVEAQRAAVVALEDLLARYAYVVDPDDMEEMGEGLAPLLAPLLGNSG